MPGTSSPVQNPYTTPSLTDSLTDDSLAHSTLQQAQSRKQTLLSKQSGNDTVIAQREREIEDIATGIIELAGIFQELQAMVIDQGSMLDRIDYNVERMGTEVKGAEKELKVATGYQKRSVKRKVMLLLLLCIVAMFVLLGLKLGTRDGGTGGDGAGVIGDGSKEAAKEAPPANGDKDGAIGAAPGALARRNVLPPWQSSSLRRRDWRRRRRRRGDSDPLLLVL